MKTNLTILAVLVALIANSQIKVDSVIPTRLCPGDSITIFYTWDGTPGLYQFDMDGQNHDYIWQVNSNTFANGKIKFKTPFWWNGGITKISTDWTNSFPIEFCERTGISEYELNPNATYKQVYGNIYVKTFEGKQTKVIFVP